MAQLTTTRLLEQSYNTEILRYQISNSVLPKSCFTASCTHPSHYQLHSLLVIDAKQREEAFSKRNHVISVKYNRHAKILPSLSVRTTVVIQNRGKKHQRRWIRSGVIVETLPLTDNTESEPMAQGGWHCKIVASFDQQHLYCQQHYPHPPICFQPRHQRLLLQQPLCKLSLSQHRQQLLDHQISYDD